MAGTTEYSVSCVGMQKALAMVNDSAPLIPRIRRIEDEPLGLGEIGVIVRVVVASGPGKGKGRIVYATAKSVCWRAA